MTHALVALGFVYNIWINMPCMSTILRMRGESIYTDNNVWPRTYTPSFRNEDHPNVIFKETENHFALTSTSSRFYQHKQTKVWQTYIDLLPYDRYTFICRRSEQCTFQNRVSLAFTSEINIIKIVHICYVKYDCLLSRAILTRIII